MRTTQRIGDCIYPYIRLTDRSPDILSQLTDVDRGDIISIMLKATVDTAEQSLRFPVPPIYRSTSWTALRSIAGIDIFNRDVTFSAFVPNHHSELMERPAMEVCSVLLSSLYTIPYSCQIFQHYFIPFSQTINKFPAYLMQNGINPSLFFATKLFQLPLCRRSAFGLKSLPLFSITPSLLFYLTPFSLETIRSDKNLLLANIYTDRITPFGFGNTTTDRDMDIDVAVPKANFSVFHRVTQKLTLIIANVQFWLHTSRKSRDRDFYVAVPKQCKEPLIQIHAKLSEVMLPMLVLLIRFRNSISCTNGKISKKIISLAHRSVSDVVQSDRVKAFLCKRYFTDIVAGISKSYRRFPYLFRFPLRRAQLTHYGLSYFHYIHIGISSIKRHVKTKGGEKGRIPPTTKAVGFLRLIYMNNIPQSYQKRSGAGILLRMRDRQVERVRRGKKVYFNMYETKIISTLYNHQTPLTTGKVTKYAGFSYNTVKKYLQRLLEKKYVKSTHHGNAVYWWLKERS